MNNSETYGRIGGLERWSRATPSDRARQGRVLQGALQRHYFALALDAFQAKDYLPSPEELMAAAENLRRAAQLRAALAGARARHEKAARK